MTELKDYQPTVLEESSRRGEIDNLIMHPWAGMDRLWLFNQIGKINGIRILEKRKPAEDGKNKLFCAEYLFGVVMRETWYEEDKTVPKALWQHTLDLLATSDYQLVEDPAPGDVVGYAKYYMDEEIKEVFGWVDGPPYFKHWGIYKGDYRGRIRVVSKWNSGHIYSHDLEMVPNMDAQEAYFFRKAGIDSREILARLPRRK